MFIIYNIFKIFIKLFLVAWFLGWLFVTAYIYWQDGEWTATMGELWFMYHNASLNLAQVIVERYLYYPLWFDVIVPYILEQPAYLVLPIAVFGTGFALSIVRKILI